MVLKMKAIKLSKPRTIAHIKILNQSNIFDIVISSVD